MVLKREEIMTDDDWEVCDRCQTILNKLNNEDIYLSKINSVVCEECHTEADKQYW